MAWDDTKDAEDLIRSNEWNNMVTDQKGRVVGTSISEVIADTAANLPAAGTTGRIFFETDTGRTLYDNGTSWIEVGLSESEIDHDSINGVVANEHIDHSTVNISAGTHLTGGGDLTTSRTLDVDESGIEADNLAGSNGTAGQVLQSDGTNASWVETPEIVAYETGHTEWATGLSNEEVHRFSNPNGFDLKQLEMQVKGGGTADAELKARLKELGAPEQLIETLTDSTSTVYSVAFTDGFLAVGSDDNKVYVYDTSTFSLQETLTDSTSTVNSVAFTDGFLAVGSSDNNVYVYDTSNFTQINESPLTDSTDQAEYVAFSSEGYLGVGSSDNNVYVYDTSTFSLQETLTDSTSTVSSVGFSSEGYLAVGSNDYNVYVYDTSTFSLQETLTDSTDQAYSVGFSSEGYLAVGSWDNNVYVYDTSDFTQINESPLTDSTDDYVYSVGFSSEGYLAVGTAFTDNNVYVYDTSDFTQINESPLTDSTDQVYSVGFSSEGYLAVGSDDNNVYVYEQKEITPKISVSAGSADSTGYTIDKDPVVISLSTNEIVDASLIVRGEKK